MNAVVILPDHLASELLESFNADRSTVCRVRFSLRPQWTIARPRINISLSILKKSGPPKKVPATFS